MHPDRNPARNATAEFQLGVSTILPSHHVNIKPNLVRSRKHIQSFLIGKLARSTTLNFVPTGLTPATQARQARRTPEKHLIKTQMDSQ